MKYEWQRQHSWPPTAFSNLRLSSYITLQLSLFPSQFSLQSDRMNYRETEVQHPTDCHFHKNCWGKKKRLHLFFKSFDSLLALPESLVSTLCFLIVVFACCSNPEVETPLEPTKSHYYLGRAEEEKGAGEKRHQKTGQTNFTYILFVLENCMVKKAPIKNILKPLDQG